MLRYCVSIVIGLFLNEAVIGLNGRFGEYQYQSSLDDYLNNTSTLYTGLSSSKIECASRCESQQPTCISFFYVQNCGKCTLHSVTFASMTGLTNVLSSNYFERAMCVSGWMYFQESCYLFVDQTATFDEAKSICTNVSSYLVHIKDSTENGFLRQYASGLTSRHHWIGLTDDVVEGTWRWTDDNDEITFEDWAPNNSQPNGGTGSNCGALWYRYDHHWVDEPCDDTYYPICERGYV